MLRVTSRPGGHAAAVGDMSEEALRAATPSVREQARGATPALRVRDLWLGALLRHARHLHHAGRPRLAAGKRPRRRSVGPRARLCRPDDKLAPGEASSPQRRQERVPIRSIATQPALNCSRSRGRCDRSPRAIPPRRRPVPPLAPKERFRGAKSAPDRGLPFDATLCRPARLDYAPGEALPLRQPGPVAA